MTGGMSILVSSFEKSVSQWIQHTLQADLYLTSDANQAATSYNRLPSSTWRAICAKPEVTDADATLITPLALASGNVRLVGANLAFSLRHNQFTWVQSPDAQDVFDPAKNGGLCVVSETYSNRFHASKGDSVLIPTPIGNRTLEIAGVYTDYGDEQGVVFADRTHVSQWFKSDDVSTLALVIAQGVDGEKFRDSLRLEFPGLAVFTNAHLRGEVLRIFRQTFAITYALEGIGIIVALAGLGVTLASVLAERRSELTTLRALGMTHNEIATSAAWEGSLLALCGSAGGLIASLALGALLIRVINKQTFGWTLQSSVPLSYLAGLGATVVLFGGAVAWGVAHWGADLPADQEA
jgi:putative ABC transport system permease protein